MHKKHYSVAGIIYRG